MTKSIVPKIAFATVSPAPFASAPRQRVMRRVPSSSGERRKDHVAVGEDQGHADGNDRGLRLVPDRHGVKGSTKTPPCYTIRNTTIASTMSGMIASGLK